MNAYKRLVYHISGWIWRRGMILGAALFLYQGILVCALARRADHAFLPYSMLWDGKALEVGLWVAALLLLVDLSRYLSAAHHGVDSLAIVPAPRWAAPLAEFTVAVGGLLFLAAVQNLAALMWYPLARWVMADTARMMGGGADAPITNGLYLAFVRSSNLRKTLPLTQWGALGAIAKLACFGAAALVIPRADRYMALLRAPAELPQAQTGERDASSDAAAANSEGRGEGLPRPFVKRPERVKTTEPRKGSPDNVKKGTRTMLFAGALCAAFVFSYGYVFAASGWGMVGMEHLSGDPAAISDMAISFEIADKYHTRTVTIEDGTIRQSTQYLQNALIWRDSTLWWVEPYWIDYWNEPWCIKRTSRAIEIHRRTDQNDTEPFFTVDGGHTEKRVLQLDGAVLVVTYYNGYLELWLLEETGALIGEYRLPAAYEHNFLTIEASWSDDVLCFWVDGYETGSGLYVLRPENGEMRKIYTSEVVPDYAAYINGKIVTLKSKLKDGYYISFSNINETEIIEPGERERYLPRADILEQSQIEIRVVDETGERYEGIIISDMGEDAWKFNNTGLYYVNFGRSVIWHQCRQYQNIRVEGTR